MIAPAVEKHSILTKGCALRAVVLVINVCFFCFVFLQAGQVSVARPTPGHEENGATKKGGWYEWSRRD